VGESSFWYRPTRVVPDQRPLNGRCCVVVVSTVDKILTDSTSVVGQNLYFCAMNFTGTLVLGFDAVGCVSGLLSCYIKCQHFFGHSETILIIIGDFVKKLLAGCLFLC